jgi:hypothetical protein
VPPHQRKRAWCGRSRILPAGDVGATRWVARWVPCVQDCGVALCGTIVHETHRDALGPLWQDRARADAQRQCNECRGRPCACPRSSRMPVPVEKTAATKTVARALCGTRDNDSAAAGRSTAMESPLPGAGRDDRRRGPPEVARRQHRPSPGAARRPLPARERRLFSPVQLRCANRHSVAPSHVDSSPSPWLGRGRG